MQGEGMAGEHDEATSRGQLDQHFLDQVGSRIRERRKTQGLTVQQLAEQAGISRRLLTQIEHGQANPSLVSITRLARQLGVDFTSLIEPADDLVLKVARAGTHTLVWSTPSGSSAVLLAVTGDTRRADLWRWRLAPGDVYQGRPDARGSHELFLVTDGRLTISVDGTDHRLTAGDSAVLRSDRYYAYRNDTRDPGQFVEFVRTVALAQ
jgi:transcriptional regulator with XRE-family HTH domain